MSKSRYDYAPDEFDAPPPQGAPAGVHRTQRSGWSKTWPFLAVIVIFAGIAYGGFLYFANQTSDAPEATTTPATSAPASSATTPAKTPDQAAPSTPATTPAQTPEQTLNKGVLVRVLNGASVSQLAAAGAEKLKTTGYTNVEADTYTGTKLAQSTVYYVASADKATAIDVGKQFGIPESQIEQVATLKGGAAVSVVLMTDYR